MTTHISALIVHGDTVDVFAHLTEPREGLARRRFTPVVGFSGRDEIEERDVLPARKRTVTVRSSARLVAWSPLVERAIDPASLDVENELIARIDAERAGRVDEAPSLAAFLAAADGAGIGRPTERVRVGGIEDALGRRHPETGLVVDLMDWLGAWRQATGRHPAPATSPRPSFGERPPRRLVAAG